MAPAGLDCVLDAAGSDTIPCQTHTSDMGGSVCTGKLDSVWRNTQCTVLAQSVCTGKLDWREGGREERRKEERDEGRKG